MMLRMPPAQLVPLEALNALDRHAFADALRPLFEAAHPLADALYTRRPFASYDQLIDTAQDLAATLSEHEQRAIVNAHPRIGGSTAALQKTSELSAREQGAQADQHTEGELRRLNAEYERRFGFRFVVFVNRRPRAQILHVLQQRLHNSPEQELATALAEMFQIARDRLATLSR